MSPDAAFEIFYRNASAFVAALSGVVDALPVPYAFAAGMLATVNPCGFVMLPAFAAFYTTVDRSTSDAAGAPPLIRALQMGVLATVSFIVVFGSAGVLITVGGHALLRWAGWAGVLVGALLIALGIYQLVTRRSLFAGATANVRVQRARSTRGVLLFGVGYAVCSLGCTLPTFLIVAGSVFLGDRDFGTSIGRFVQYALGMGLVLTVVAVGVAVARDRMSKWVRRLMPMAEGAANVFLVLAGLYLVWYWTVKGSVL